MPVLVDNLGLDLPVFDGPVHATHCNAAQDEQTMNSFVRRIHTSNIARALPLKELLHIADNVFTEAARSYEAEVVDHTWGLIEPTDESMAQTASSFGPYVVGKHILAAEVQVIKPTPDAEEKRWSIFKEFGQHLYPTNKQPGEWYWYDDNVWQYLYGSADGQAPKLHLVDIDIMLERFGV